MLPAEAPRATRFMRTQWEPTFLFLDRVFHM
jgi:hypothetical protein